MKNMFVLLTLFFVAQNASAEIIILDKTSVQDYYSRRTKSFVLTVRGKVQNLSKEKNTQLTIYVRSCGQVQVPKNSKGDIPSEGQNITASLKERCKIDDWN